MARPIDPTVRRRLAVLALVLAVVVVAAIAVVLARKTQADTAAAARQARDYHQPVVTPTPTLPIVSAIGDGFTSGSGADSGTDSEWPALVSNSLQARVVVLAEPSMGYVRGAGDNLTTTFSSEATTVFPTSKVVLIFGGIADEGSNPALLLAAARTTYATAKAAAPRSTVVAVGPLWDSTDPPAAVLAVRDALALAAQREGVRFVDPIAAGWLSGVSGAFARGGSALSDTGQAALAKRMESLLRPLL